MCQVTQSPLVLPQVFKQYQHHNKIKHNSGEEHMLKKQQESILNGDKKSSVIFDLKTRKGKKINFVKINAFSWKHMRLKSNHMVIRLKTTGSSSVI